MAQRNVYIIFSVSILLLILCACEQNFNSTNNLTSTQLDTLQIWIKEGRNTALDLSARQEKLAQAFNSTAKINNDSLKTKLYSRLSLAYLKLGDSMKFRETNRLTATLAKKIEDSLTLAETDWDLGDFFRDESVADSAYYHYSEAQKIFKILGKDYSTGTMLNNMAIVQVGVKDYTGSEITTIQAIEIFKELKDYQQLYTGFNVLGIISVELNEYNRALEYYTIALEYQKKISEPNNLDLDLKNNIGIVYQEQERYEESIPYFTEVINTESQLSEYTKLYAIALNNLAYSRSKINPNLEVTPQFEEAIQIQDSIGDIFAVSRTHYNLADYYLRKSDTTQALIQAKKAQSYGEMANNNDRVLQALRLLTRIDPKNSSAYNQRYITLNDSLQEAERQVRDKFARIRFETDEYIAENEVLTSEKQLWAGIALAVFLLGSSAYMMLNQRSKNQKLRFQQQQQASNQEIFDLMLAQNEKEEEAKKAEQKRISEELHDSVLGQMMGSRMVLTGLNKKKDGDAEAKRKKAIDALQNVEKEIREISHELSDAAYKKIHNFMASLRELLHSVEASSDIDCKLEYDSEQDWDALKGDVKINVYRMVQESIQNSIKHARCTTIRVAFASQENILTVKISDDGKGFRTKKRKKGIGMRNIASRIERLKGKWHIDSVIGKGTAVVLCIPMSVAVMENHIIRPTENAQLAEKV